MRPKRRRAEVPPELAAYTPARWHAVDPDRPATAYCDALLDAGVDEDRAQDMRADAVVSDIRRRLGG